MFVRFASKNELPISVCEIGSVAFVMRITTVKKSAGLGYETGNFNDRDDASDVR
jgi:hypothetical protein